METRQRRRISQIVPMPCVHRICVHFCKLISTAIIPCTRLYQNTEIECVHRASNKQINKFSLSTLADVAKKYENKIRFCVTEIAAQVFCTPQSDGFFLLPFQVIYSIFPLARNSYSKARLIIGSQRECEFPVPRTRFDFRINCPTVSLCASVFHHTVLPIG